MRIGYFGSPWLSAKLLEALLNMAEKDSSCEVSFVVTNSDKPQGRSRHRLLPTAVASLVLSRRAAQQKVPILLRCSALKDIIDRIKEFAVDLLVVFAYGKILPPELLQLAPLGAINLHASLLPKLRGASPIQSSILQGFNTTGWSVQRINSQLDAGDIIARKELAIGPQETCGELTERMLPLGIELVMQCLEDIPKGRAQAIAQDHKQATYCTKVIKADARIRWDSPAQQIYNVVRAYNPKPVAWTVLENTKLRIYKTALLSDSIAKIGPWENATIGSFGAANDRRELWVQTKQGILSILELQFENRRRMRASEFLHGYRRDGLVVLE